MFGKRLYLTVPFGVDEEDESACNGEHNLMSKIRSKNILTYTVHLNRITKWQLRNLPCRLDV